MRIIFVCTSNVCRSPPAAALAAKWLREHQRDGEVTSRSISTDYEPENSPASDYSVQIMRDDFGIDISSHRSRLLSEEDIREADVIVGITSSHRQHIINKFPRGQSPELFSLQVRFTIHSSGKDNRHASQCPRSLAWAIFRVS
jgi:protein-tyrosine-phosphatase